MKNLRQLSEQKDLCQLSELRDSRPFAFLNQASFARWAPIPLRLIVGYGFMQHGFAKLSKGPEAFAAILHAIGVPAPHFMAWLTILVEVFGGVAVLMGALVPLASLPMAGVLIVAMLTVHWPYGFSSIKIMSVTNGRAQFGPPGYETDLLYLACLAALVIGGSGPMAIDGYLKRKRQSRLIAKAFPTVGTTESQLRRRHGRISSMLVVRHEFASSIHLFRNLISRTSRNAFDWWHPPSLASGIRICRRETLSNTCSENLAQVSDKFTEWKRYFGAIGKIHHGYRRSAYR